MNVIFHTEFNLIYIPLYFIHSASIPFSISNLSFSSFLALWFLTSHFLFFMILSTILRQFAQFQQNFLFEIKTLGNKKNYKSIWIKIVVEIGSKWIFNGCTRNSLNSLNDFCFSSATTFVCLLDRFLALLKTFRRTHTANSQHHNKWKQKRANISSFRLNLNLTFSWTGGARCEKLNATS